MNLSPGPKSICDYLAAILQQAKENRQPIELKWQQDWSDFVATAKEKACWDNTGHWKPSDDDRKGWKSTNRSDGTRQKVQTAHAQLMDIFFQGGRIPFMLSFDERAMNLPDEDANAQITGAMDAIEDDIQSCSRSVSAQEEFGMALLFGGVYGEMIVKGHVEDVTDSMYQPSADGMMDSVQMVRPTIAAHAIDPWDIWRDLEEPDIRRSQFVFEYTPANLYRLREWKALAYHDAAALDRCILKHRGQQGLGRAADTSHEAPWRREVLNRTSTIPVYECWALVPTALIQGVDWTQDAEGRMTLTTGAQFDVAPREDYAVPPGEQPLMNVPTVAPAPTAAADESDMTWIFCKIDLDAMEVIAFHADPGPHRYRNEYWEQDLDRKQGRSIADNNACNQHTLDGLIQAYDNQLKIMSSIILLLNRCKFINGSSLEKTITEGGVLEVETDLDDIRKAFELLQLPDITGPIVKGIESFMAFSDLSTHVPRIEQGQQTFEAQTLGELHMRLEQGGKYLGSVARRFDNLIEWFAQENYDYRMGNPDGKLPRVPAIVKALGFTSFQNRYVRSQKLMAMLQAAMQFPPIAAITKIRWLWEEYGKATDLEADQYIKSIAEMQAEQPPPPDPNAVADADLKHAKAEQARTHSGIALGKAVREAAQPAAAPVNDLQRAAVGTAQTPAQGQGATA